MFCLFPVLFNFAVLFFHKPFVLMALRMLETSLVRVVIAPPSLAFLLRPRFYLLCINTNDYYYNTIFHVKGGSGKYIKGIVGNISRKKGLGDVEVRGILADSFGIIMK